MSVAYNSLVFSHPDENLIAPPSSPPQYRAMLGGAVNNGEATPTPGDESARRIMNDMQQKNTLHWPSLICVMSIGFIANCEYGVVMPSVWNYLQSIGGTESQLGFAISAASAAQLCCLPLFGLWSDRRTMRETITAAMLLGISGNILYALAQWLHSPYAIIAGRMLSGMYMGVTAVTNSFVAHISTPETRTKLMAQINGINAIGMVSGPGFNLFLNLKQFNIGPVRVDGYTTPGWFIAFLVTCSFVCFWIFFKEPAAAHTKNPQFSTNYKSVQDVPAAPPKITGKQYAYFIVTSIFKPYGACFIICFVQNFDFSVLETIATILTSQFYHFKDFQNSLFYSALSIEMVVVIFITAFASRLKVDDRYILLVAQAFVGAGSTCMLFFYTKPHIPFWMFALFAGLLIAGIPSQNISVMSTYSKLLTAEFGAAKQGLYTGIIMIFGSLARILGPLWGSNMVKDHAVILFSLLVGLWAFDVMFTLSFFKKLKPNLPESNDEKVSLLIH